jgi:hypothetical protein
MPRKVAQGSVWQVPREVVDVAKHHCHRSSKNYSFSVISLMRMKHIALFDVRHAASGCLWSMRRADEVWRNTCDTDRTTLRRS